MLVRLVRCGYVPQYRIRSNIARQKKCLAFARLSASVGEVTSMDAVFSIADPTGQANQSVIVRLCFASVNSDSVELFLSCDTGQGS